MKSYLYLLFLLAALPVAAQVTITPVVPPAGILQKNQLWNVVLASAAERPLQARVILRLLDAEQGQPVLSGVSRAVTLTRGARQLKQADVEPVQYEYLSPAIDRNVNALLPPGKYLACYNIEVSGGKTAYSREECVPIVVEPISPPLLNLPANGALLDTKVPQFTWLPPAPLQQFRQLRYELLVTEVHDGQPPVEAVQQNVPVLRMARLRENFLSYPPGHASLDTGKTYAWTVIAKEGEHYAAQTEVWTFRLNGGKLQHLQDLNKVYVQLRRELDGNVLHASREISVSYTNETGDSAARWELLALEDGNRELMTGQMPLVRGANHFDIPIPARSGLTAGKSYLFRLKNSRGEYWQLKFIYRKES